MVTDAQGQVLGGNGRKMILDRVYSGNPEGAAAYRALLKQKAAQFGVDPAAVDGMKQPVLVREIADAELSGANAKQKAVTDFNKKGSRAVTAESKILSITFSILYTQFFDAAVRPHSTLEPERNKPVGRDASLSHSIKLMPAITQNQFPPRPRSGPRLAREKCLPFAPKNTICSPSPLLFFIGGNNAPSSFPFFLGKNSAPSSAALPILTIPHNHKRLLYLKLLSMPTADTLSALDTPTQTPSSGGEKKILLLKPRGFCAGVVRAIDVVKIALDLYGAPIYVRKEIVHNRHVVDELRQAGAIFVEELAEVPEGARVIFSAHGIAPAVRQEAIERKLLVIDATCPLVTKVHLEAVKLAKQGFTIVLIGHRDHDEVIGTLGEAPESTILVSDVADVDNLRLKNPDRVAYLTQTTLSLDETKDIVTRLMERFPKIVGPKTQDICYATENRQLAVKAVAPLCDTLLVVGSQNSSNSRRLVEVCEKAGIPAYLLDDCGEVEARMLAGVNTVAVTAGASAPEHLVEELVSHLRAKGFSNLEEVEIKEEDVRFTLPSDLEKFTPRLHPVRA